MALPRPGEPLDSDQVVDLVEQRNMAWVDQYNQHLVLTVQAMQKLHAAFDKKFAR